MAQSSDDQDKLRFSVKPLNLSRLHPRRRVMRRFRKIRRRVGKVVKPQIVVIALIVGVTVIVGGQTILFTDAANQLQNSQQNFDRVMRSFANKDGTELTLTDFNRLESSLNDLSRSLELTRNRTVLLRPIASFNPDWAAYMDGLDAAEELVNASRNMLSGIEPTLFFMVRGETEETVVTQISSGERLVELLDVGRGRFLRAQDDLEAARVQLDAIQVENTSADTLMLVEQVETYYEQLTSMNDLLLQMPEILTIAFGLEEDASYLILAMNNDELRPAGGFISTWGWMTVRNGRITDFDYSASEPDSPTPPDLDLADYYTIPSWWLRFEQPIYAAWDGNWHTDFSSAAEIAAWYYNNGEGNPHTPIDGVIAIDISGFQYILGGLEQVMVPEYDVVVTPDNFRAVVYDVRTEGNHKDFVTAVYEAIFDDWSSVDRDPQQSTAVFGSMLQALRERHLMVYLSDENSQEALSLLGWSGTQSSATSHDYLMVVDANVSPNKSNKSVLRQWTYDVVIEPDGSLRSRASITYDYPDAVASQDPAVDPRYHGPLNYHNLLQVITPAGSESVSDGLEDDVRIVEISREDDYTRFVSIFTVEYDTAERVQFSYETPPLVEQFGSYNRYRLLLQKQPGTRGEPVTVQVTLPEGAELISSAPAFATSYTLEQLILDYRVTLDTDQWIEIIFR